MTEKQSDNYIMVSEGCGDLYCEKCFYGGAGKKNETVSCIIKINYCDGTFCRNCNFFINNIECGYIYEYVSNKHKLKRIKEILQ